MMNEILLMFAFLGLAVEAPEPSNEVQINTIENLKILSFSGRPISNSGYVGSYAKIEAGGEDGKIYDLYIPVLTSDQKFPEIGYVCTFKFYSHNIDGVLGAAQQQVNLKNVSVVEGEKCSK